MDYLYDMYSSYYSAGKEPINGNMERLNKPLESLDDQQSLQVDDERKIIIIPKFSDENVV